MYELKIITSFAAAHQLRMVGHKCENLHGHNWKIEVFLTGDTLDDAGVLLDFGVIKGHVRGLMDTLDHKFLNDLPFFNGNSPSSENIAKYIAETLQSILDQEAAQGRHDPGTRVSRVTAWESEDACATYYPR